MPEYATRAATSACRSRSLRFSCPDAIAACMNERSRYVARSPSRPGSIRHHAHALIQMLVEAERTITMPHHAWYRPPGAVAHNNAAYSEHARDGSGTHLQFFLWNSVDDKVSSPHAVLHLQVNGREVFHISIIREDPLNLYIIMFFLNS